ncbi:hypothetical protein [Methylobacterium fujisawaense]
MIFSNGGVCPEIGSSVRALANGHGGWRAKSHYLGTPPQHMGNPSLTIPEATDPGPLEAWPFQGSVGLCIIVGTDLVQNFAYISKACELRQPGGPPVAGRLASITDRGAVVEVPDPFAVPEMVVLAVRRTERPCRVMWRANGQVAMVFEDAA